MACKGLDEQVVRHDSDSRNELRRQLQELEKQFVCVRLVQMKGVDLELFQFDYDQTWAVFFLNADRTIYGRYGTRAGDKAHSTTHISLAGFKKAMQRALALHAEYPRVQSELRGKRGARPRFDRAEKIPTLARKALGPTTEKTCIHCHMVSSHERKLRYDEKKLSPHDIWVWPLPENVGLKMRVDDDVVVERVLAGSPAEEAGVRPGDLVVALADQRIISQADIQWVLHNAPDRVEVPLEIERAGVRRKAKLSLAGPWRQSDLSWRETSWSLRPGIWTVPLSDADRERHGIAPDALGLRVKWVFPRARLARQAGLRDRDIIVAVDGHTEPMDESEFLAYVRLNHPPGDKVELTILRGGERRAIELELE